jgi:hypothetical protein
MTPLPFNKKRQPTRDRHASDKKKETQYYCYFIVIYAVIPNKVKTPWQQ